MSIQADDPAECQDVHVYNLVFAGEHLSNAFYGYMNGAAQTGRLAAAVIVGRIQMTAPIQNIPSQKVGV
ncbi:MAG: FAD-dependent oxidoreductase [bacterium]|nr:FAD-dependent oxidoreductase [bacterium]